MAKLENVIQRGTRGAQPAAASVAVGTLYFVTGENVIERSSGVAWETYSGPAFSGSGGSIGGPPGMDGDDSFIEPFPLYPPPAPAASGSSTPVFGSVPYAVPQAWFRRWESWIAAPATTFTMGQTTINFANKSNVTDNGGSWADLGSAVSGTLCDAVDNSNFCQPEGDPTWRTHIRTDASAVTSQRFWGGLTQNAAFADTDSPNTGTGKCIAFRYSTVAGDTGFVGVTVDGTGQATTALIATINTNTEYTLEFVVSATGTSVLFTVYDNNGAVLGTPRTATTKIPTGTAVKSGISFIPQTNAQRDLYIRGVHTESR